MNGGKTGPGTRLHHWDFARALYLVLGIPFHAAVAYSLSHEWSVSSPDKSQVLTWLADFIHTFRMPGFFVLAGLFSMMLLDRQGAGPWLRTRLLRLGLPLLAAMLTIIPFQIVIQSSAAVLTGQVPASGFTAHAVAMFGKFGEPWISHLWFLWALLAYSVALAFAHRGLEMLKGRGPVSPDRLRRTMGRTAGADPLQTRSALTRSLSHIVLWVADNRTLAFAAFVALCAMSTQIQSLVVTASPFYGNAVINYNLYVVYFVLGAVLHASPLAMRWFTRPGRLGFATGVLLVTASQYDHGSLATHTLAVMAGIIGAVLIIGHIAQLAARHCSAPDARVRRVVDASFTIYLFHHPVIYALATMFILVDLPPVVEFLLIAPAAAVISYGIHRALGRCAGFRLLFNGVLPKRRDPHHASRSPAAAKPGANPVAAFAEGMAMSIARPYPQRL